MRIPDQSLQLQFRTVRRRFKGRYRRAVGPIEVTALLNVIVLAGMFHFAAARFVGMLPPVAALALALVLSAQAASAQDAHAGHAGHAAAPAADAPQPPAMCPGHGRRL